jgi:predicted ATPase/DNA-binding XRE family transcriptional regulator
MDTFGEWLRQQRTQLHLTRPQFADRVGCSVALLRKVEDGERHPSEQIAELLANALNIPPAERSTFVRVARGELRVDRLAPAANASPASPIPRINLPVLPTPLIGRQREVAELSQLLDDAQCRLLTLVGPGGIGKTRLAIETATQIQDRFAAGVYFVPLASVHNPRLLVPLIADALGFPFASAGTANPQSQLFGYLQAKELLLLIDNLEQLLVEPGIELLMELLAQAPQVKLLATSREALGLQDEWVFEVPGLPIPETSQAATSTQNPAVELFLQRARRANARFTVTPADYPAIVRICQLVEGMPLGLELAAAWVRTLTCAEIAEQIAYGLDFLHLSARDLPPRHRSLRAVFDHSWQLLNAEEQRILCRLALFRGGFPPEAAAVVAGATLADLATLLMKSFIRRSATGRYELHELVRQFAAEQLAQHPAEQSAAQTAHSHYYLTFFSHAAGPLRSAAQQATLAALSAEMDNFRSAWAWAITQGDFVWIEPALHAFTLFYDLRGWFQEGFDTLGHGLTALEIAYTQSPADDTIQRALGHLLSTRGLLASRLGHYQQAQAMLERSLVLLRPLSAPRVLVEALTILGTILELTGNYARALALYTEGWELATALGDRWVAAVCRLCRTGLVGITQKLVTPEETYTALHAVMAEWRAIGDPRWIAIGLNHLSWNAMSLGRYAEGRAALEESVALALAVGDRWGTSYAYRGLGLIAQTLGDHQQAVTRFRQSLTTLSELGARQDVARLHTELSWSLFAQGDDAEAARGWRAALRMAGETSGTFIALEALVGLAMLQAKQGDIGQASALLLMVLHHPASMQATKQRAERLQRELAAQLTSQQVEAVQAYVQTKSFEAVVDEILKQAQLT